MEQLTHDAICRFDPKWCRDCQLQIEARASERAQVVKRLRDLPASVWGDDLTQLNLERIFAAVRGDA